MRRGVDFWTPPDRAQALHFIDGIHSIEFGSSYLSDAAQIQRKQSLTRGTNLSTWRRFILLPKITASTKPALSRCSNVVLLVEVHDVSRSIESVK
jgi:hypothetical protein